MDRNGPQWTQIMTNYRNWDRLGHHQ